MCSITLNTRCPTPVVSKQGRCQGAAKADCSVRAGELGAMRGMLSQAEQWPPWACKHLLNLGLEAPAKTSPRSFHRCGSSQQLDPRSPLHQVGAGLEQPNPARERLQSILVLLDPCIIAGDRNLFNLISTSVSWFEVKQNSFSVILLFS